MSISDWTNGKVQPTAENIYAVAVFFDVTADYLLGLEDETGAKLHNNYGIRADDVRF